MCECLSQYFACINTLSFSFPLPIFKIATSFVVSSGIRKYPTSYKTPHYFLSISFPIII
jgi:hypothetical protein